jgi:molybdenum cofactor biosynthesis enzyme MoaA
MSIKNSKDFIELELHIISMCNQSCFYCFEVGGKNWNKILKDYEIILENISDSKLPIHVSLLGGEPTLHPKFIDIINSMIKIPIIEYIYIFTNATEKATNKITKIKYSNKLIIAASYHPANISVDEYVRSINKLTTLNIPIKCNIMLLESHLKDINECTARLFKRFKRLVWKHI